MRLFVSAMLAALTLGGCGNTPGGSLNSDLEVSDSLYLELALADGRVTPVSAPDDLTLVGPRWRSTHVLFRRVDGGTARGTIDGLPQTGQDEDTRTLHGRLAYLAVFELTASQWRRLADDTDVADSDLPVASLAPSLVRACVQARSCSRFRLDLPDGGTWMRACIGGQAELFAWGNSTEKTISANYANHYPTASGLRRGGSLLPNAQGLYDMHGNLAEMTLAADGSYEIRGGAWDSPILVCRAANVVALPKDLAHPGVGIRLALIP